MKNSQHGMTSEMASLKKISGHFREVKRLSNLDEGSVIVKGNGKVDILRNDGKTESVKGGKKSQWSLYTIDRLVSDNYFSESEISAINRWVDFIPNDKYDWEKNREKYSLNPYAAGLVEIFKDNPIKLINYFCGVNLVDYLVIEDMRDGVWRVTSMNDFSNTIKNNIKNVYNTEGGKLVISGGEKNNILFEMELRKGNVSHKRILFHSPLVKIIDCLK